jgi:cell division protein FtsB
MSLLRFPPFRRAGLILGLMLAAAYVTVALLGPNGVSALVKQRQELDALERDNANLQKIRDELRENVKALETDKETQELAAREKIGKVKKNEKVIKVDPVPAEPLGPPADPQQ